MYLMSPLFYLLKWNSLCSKPNNRKGGGYTINLIPQALDCESWNESLTLITQKVQIKISYIL